MLVEVLGLDGAKAGRLPTDAEHDRLAALLDAAMDAGGCGWSAQRLPPTGPAAVQRDFDGTPMPTDVMHDETCRVLARVLAERNQGVQQMTLTTDDIRHDIAHLEEIATMSGRPILHNVVQAFETEPHVHRKAIEWLERCRERGIPIYGQGVTTDAGFTFTFEDWNLYDDSEAWMEATTGTLEERLHKLADPARRQGLKDKLPNVATAPLDRSPCCSPRVAGDRARTARCRWARSPTLTGQAPRRRDARHRRRRRAAHRCSTSPRRRARRTCCARSCSTRTCCSACPTAGAHTKFLTAGRYPTETLAQQVRDNGWITYEEAHRRLSGLPAQLAGFHDRGLLRVDGPADVVVYDPERPRGRPEPGRRGPPRRRVAAHPEGDRLPRRPRQRRADDRRRHRDRAPPRPPAAPRPRLTPARLRRNTMTNIGMSDEVRELRGRMKDFIDGPVMKAEHEVERLAEQDLHPETGLPIELYEAAEAKGLDTSRGVPGPGDAATRRSAGPIADLQDEAKRAGCGRSATPRRSAAAACRSCPSST